MTAESSPPSQLRHRRPTPLVSRRRAAGAVGALVVAIAVSMSTGSAGHATGPRSGVVPAAATPPRTTLCLAVAALPSTEVTVALPAPAAELVLRRSRSYLGPCAKYGTASPLGAGTVRTYVQRQSGRPLSVGVVFGSAMLNDLPTAPNDGHHCYDVDGDGRVDPVSECAGGHERPLDLAAQPDVPLSWALVNWNPQGHGAPGVYSYPHFDFHFYLQPKAERDAIGPGACAIILDCNLLKTGVQPVPPQYFPEGYTDIGAVETAMGNHLVDQSGPEWHQQPFEAAMIYGAYAGKVTFIEPMLSKAYLEDVRAGTGGPACRPIKQPQQWLQPGYYPTEYCVHYRANRDDFTVSIDSFVQYS